MRGLMAIGWLALASVVWGQYTTVPATQYPALEAILNAKGTVRVGAGAPTGNCTVGLDFWLTNQAGGGAQSGDFWVCSAAPNVWTKLQAALGFTAENAANKAVAGGYASLDGGGKVPVGQVPAIAESGVTSLVADLAGKEAAIASGTQDQVLNGIKGLTSLVNCVAAGGVVQYATSTHTFSCHTLAAADIPNILESQVTSLVSDLAGKEAAIAGGTQDQVLNGIKGLTSLVNCVAAGGVVQYATSTHTFSCHTLAAGDIPNIVESQVTAPAVNPQTSTYQVLAGDFSNRKTIPVASGTFTITLVASGSQPATGQYIDVTNYGSGVVTIARSGQLLNGAAANLTLPAGSASAPTSMHIVSDGTNYIASLGGAGGSSAPTGSGIPRVVSGSFVSPVDITLTSYLNAGSPALYKYVFGLGEVAGDSITLSTALTAASNTIEVASTMPASGVPGTFEFTSGTKLVESTQATVSGSVASVYACFGRAGNGSACELSSQFKLGQSLPNFQRQVVVNPIQGASTMGIVVTFSCYNSSNVLTNCGNGSTSSVTAGVLQWTLSGANNVQ